MIKQVKITVNDANDRERQFLQILSGVPNQKQYIIDCVLRCSGQSDQAATKQDIQDAVEELKHFLGSTGQQDPVKQQPENEEKKKKGKKLCDW